MRVLRLALGALALSAPAKSASHGEPALVFEITIFFEPFDSPTPAPSGVPSPAPSATPTSPPTGGPSPQPSPAPSDVPTVAPTNQPSYDTDAPSFSVVPTSGPTPLPSRVPTSEPTYMTNAPTSEPTYMTEAPSGLPTAHPTAAPTSRPSPSPTSLPTSAPTAVPSATPTAVPSSHPTFLAFGVHFCQDFATFGIAAFWREALATVSNASFVDYVNCSDDTTNNRTAHVSAHAHFFASDEVRRELGEDVESVSFKINDRVRRAAVNGSLFTRKLQAAISARRRSLRATDPYYYQANDALEFVSAARALSVETAVVGTSVPTSVPTPVPSPAPTGVPTSVPTSYPTAQCPTWATTQNCPEDCLCCTAYNVSAGVNGSLPTGARQANKKSPHSQCLICYHGYECVDVDDDGDGECVENATTAAGSSPGNLCDWWLWAWYYGPTNEGLENPNGHSYEVIGPDRYELTKSHYLVGGENCSADFVEVIKPTAEGRTIDGDFKACRGLFSQGNNTQFPSGSPFIDHDREGSVCYEDFRGAAFRGYCSYATGPAACARCNSYPSDVLVVQGEIGFLVRSTQTADELNDDLNFTSALATSIFESSGLLKFPKLDATNPRKYVQDLLVYQPDRRRRYLLAGTTMAASYSVVVSPTLISISSSSFSTSITTAQNLAVLSGSFTTLLMHTLAVLKVQGISVNITSASALSLAVTLAPTLWSDTAEAVVPVAIQKRTGGETDLPPCDCEDTL
ncbi:hypothetical protein M885DRAFT_616737 [Pelagophyceae sp. CCMP2097]|nr:hypothetical protein M885DRAFT_616737 [Pelagophyceae sp. CCMP2097]